MATKTKATPPNAGEQRLREAEEKHAATVEEAQQLFEQQDGAKTGTDSSYQEPPSDPDNPIANPNGDFYDNPENPRGIPDYLTDGMPDSQATDSQKIQNPTPKRPPLPADMDPPVTIQERVSAAQNRRPPQEVVP